MTDLISADWHLSDNPRDEYRFEFLERRLPKLLKQFKVNRLYLLGDLTESKNYHGGGLVNRIIDGLVNLTDPLGDPNAPDIILLRGNHDYEADPEHPFFGFADYIEGLRYINHPFKDGNDLLLPHTRDPEEWKRLDLSGVQTILTHATFSGAVGSNRTPLAGIAPPSTFIPIISGDVHVPQKVGNVTYVGSPYSIDFGDAFEPRVLVRDGTKLTSVKLKGPQKRVVEVDGDYKSLANEGDIVRLKIKLERADYDRWTEIREVARKEAEGFGWIVESVLPITEPDQIVRGEPRRGPQSDAQTLQEYCQKYQVDERIAKQGEELL